MAALPPNIRINAMFPFPVLVTGTAPITIAKANGIWTVGIAVGNLGTIIPLAPAYPTDFLLVYDSVLNTYFKVSLTTLGVAGSRVQRYVTATPVIVATDQFISMNISAGTPTVLLPASGTRGGVPLTFKDLGQAAAHNITLKPNGAELIDGLANVKLTANYQAITLVPFNDGTNSGWMMT